MEVPPVFFDFYGGFSLVIFNFQGGSGNCSLGVLSAMRRYHAFIPCSRFLFWLLGRSCILHVALPVMFGALCIYFFSLFLIWLRSDLLCLCLRLCVLSAWCDVRCLFVSRFLAVRVRVCALCECPTRMFSCSFGHTRAHVRAHTHTHAQTQTHTVSQLASFCNSPRCLSLNLLILGMIDLGPNIGGPAKSWLAEHAKNRAEKCKQVS